MDKAKLEFDLINSPFSEDQRTQMAQQAREMLDKDNVTGLIDGGNEETVDYMILSLIAAYPSAKESRPENPNYSFAEMVDDFSARVTGSIIGSGLRNTRGALAARYEE